MCDDGAELNFVATQQTYNAVSSADYISPMATLTACQLVDPTCTTPGSIVGDATEHLYQLNHVYVALPNKEDSIKTKDERLFARLDVWDYSKKISLAFRSKAMLQLASLGENDAKEYEDRLANKELRHPLLASLRLHVKTKPQKQESDASSPGARTPYSPGSPAVCTPQKDRNGEEPDKVFMDAIVVEAAPCTYTEIPNESVKALQGLLARCTQTSERLAAVPLGKLTPSPFHNMLADGKPVHKALTLKNRHPEVPPHWMENHKHLVLAIDSFDGVEDLMVEDIDAESLKTLTSLRTNASQTLPSSNASLRAVASRCWAPSSTTEPFHGSVNPSAPPQSSPAMCRRGQTSR